MLYNKVNVGVSYIRDIVLYEKKTLSLILTPCLKNKILF